MPWPVWGPRRDGPRMIFSPRSALYLVLLSSLVACQQEGAESETELDAALQVDAAPEGDAAVDAEAEAEVEVDAEPDAEPEPTEPGLDVLEVEGLAIINGRSGLLEVELPADVLSLSILIEGAHPNFYAVGHLEGPEDNVLVSEAPEGVQITVQDRYNSVFPGPAKSPNRSITAAQFVGGLLAPNNPGVDLTPGLWRYEVVAADSAGEPANTSADVTLQIKRGPEPVEGTLDLHLHFTGSRGWDAVSAQDAPDFQRALARMAGFYAEIGIHVGEVTYQDVDPEFRSVAADGAGRNAPLHRLFANSRADTGVSLFFVDEITSQFGAGFIGGVAGGTPGPTLLPGTPRSGVVVATEGPPDSIGHVMGHETGHFLGLYHTQEVTGVTDQIDDTPAGRDGASNLMFPTVTSEPAELSDGQAWVLHRSPAVDPVQ